MGKKKKPQKAFDPSLYSTSSKPKAAPKQPEVKVEEEQPVQEKLSLEVEAKPQQAGSSSTEKTDVASQPTEEEFRLCSAPALQARRLQGKLEQAGIVSLSEELDAEITEILRQHYRDRWGQIAPLSTIQDVKEGLEGSVSGDAAAASQPQALLLPTPVKLAALYRALLDLGWSADHIERAILSLLSPDNECLPPLTVNAALDWLCLHVAEAGQPARFVENQIITSGPKATKSGDASQTFEGGEDRDEVAARPKCEEPSDGEGGSAKQEQAKDHPVVRESHCVVDNAADDDDAPAVQSDFSSSEEDSDIDNEYLRGKSTVEKELLGALEAVAVASGRNKKKAHKKAQDLEDELREMGGNPDKIRAKWEQSQARSKSAVAEKKVGVVEEDRIKVKSDGDGECNAAEEGDGGMFGMFDEEAASEQPVAASVSAAEQKEELCKHRYLGVDVDSILASFIKVGSSKRHKSKRQTGPPTVLDDWTGKIPKTILDEWLTQTYGKSATKVVYKSLEPVTGWYQCEVVVQWTKKSEKREVGEKAVFDSKDLFDSRNHGENVAATMALFQMASAQNTHVLLPPAFKAVWKVWKEEKERLDEQEMLKKNRRMIDFVRTACKEFSVGQLRSSQQSTSHVEETNTASACSGRGSDQSERGARLQGNFKRQLNNSKYQELAEFRSTLPVNASREEILEEVSKSNVVLIIGETGSGKTTQIPQYLYEEMLQNKQGHECNIICTQPRRISAISVANRVADERGESLGKSIGYQIRLEKRTSDDTVLTFVTVGILLRRLQSDPRLDGVSHVVVDEVHERDIQTDFLLLLLKSLIRSRPSLKVILMSATMNADMFSQYFNHCPTLNIPGRTFPVRTFYLEDAIEMSGTVIASDSPYAKWSKEEKNSSVVQITGRGGEQRAMKVEWETESEYYDPNKEDLFEGYSDRTKASLNRIDENKINYELIVDLVALVCEGADEYISDVCTPDDDGSILVFLPGMVEITTLYDMLTSHPTFGDEEKFVVLPLHSSLASKDQQAVFRRPKRGQRKLILSTNIAETSVTIDDVTCVIDSGKMKETRYNASTRMRSLVETWVSNANARQRRGRAGRVREGIAFHLFTKVHSETRMAAFQKPEIMRVPLEELCLQVQVMGIGDVRSTLKKAIQSPNESAVEAALSTLRAVGAIDASEYLTPLGSHLAKLPVDVHIGKMLIFGAMLGSLSEVLTIASAMSFKSPFVRPFERRAEADAARKSFAVIPSDHFAIIHAYTLWEHYRKISRSREREFLHRNFLSMPSLNGIRDMRENLFSMLCDIGFADKNNRSQMSVTTQGEFNEKAVVKSLIESFNLASAVLVTGLYPNVCRVQVESGLRQRINYRSGNDGVALHKSSVVHEERNLPYDWLVFTTKWRIEERVFIHDASPISPEAILLFGGAITIGYSQGLVQMDSWINFRCRGRTAVLFKELRRILDSILKAKVDRPKADTLSEQKQVINLVQRLCIGSPRGGP